MNTARQKLGVSEKEFWRMTMRKFDILWRSYVDFNLPKQTTVTNRGKNRGNDSNERAFIDELPFM